MNVTYTEIETARNTVYVVLEGFSQTIVTVLMDNLNFVRTLCHVFVDIESPSLG